MRKWSLFYGTIVQINSLLVSTEWQKLRESYSFRCKLPFVMFWYINTVVCTNLSLIRLNCTIIGFMQCDSHLYFF